METLKLKKFNNLDKWMAAAEAHELALTLRKSGPCWEMIVKTGEVVGQIYVGKTFTGKPYGWMSITVQKSA